MSYIANRHSLSFGSEARLASAIPKFRRNLNEISANGIFGCIQSARAETTKNAIPARRAVYQFGAFVLDSVKLHNNSISLIGRFSGRGSSGGP